MVDGRRWRPREGDRVVVPWGLGIAPGTVRRIYGPPGRPTALVSVILDGDFNDPIAESTVSFPLGDLQPPEPAAAG